MGKKDSNIEFPLSFVLTHKASNLIDNPRQLLAVNFREERILELLKSLKTKNLIFVFAMVCNKKKIVFKVNPFKEKASINFPLDSADKMLLIQIQDNEQILDSFSFNVIDLNFSLEKKKLSQSFNFLGKNFELEFVLSETTTIENLENSNANSIKSEKNIKNIDVKNNEGTQGKEDGMKGNKKKEENEVEKMKKLINDIKKENNNIFSQINHETVLFHSYFNILNFLESA